MGIYKAKIDSKNYAIYKLNGNTESRVFSIPTSSVKGYYFKSVKLTDRRVTNNYHFCLITTLGIFDFTELGYTTSFGFDDCDAARSLIETGIADVEKIPESETVIIDTRQLKKS